VAGESFVTITFALGGHIDNARTMTHDGGWTSYSSFGPAAPAGVRVVMHQSVADSTGPELADLGRMRRRLVRRFVAAARVDERPSLRSMLTAHFGPEATSLPVVADSWAPYEHVNVQLGLEGWLARDGREHRLVGVTGFQHRQFALADLAGEEVYGGGLGVGSVAMANQSSGPDGRTYPCVQCALYLVQSDEGPLAVLLRGSDSRGAQQNVSIEIMATDTDHAARSLAAIRDVAKERNVFRGQVLSFGSQMFGPDHAPIVFERRASLDRSALILPDEVLRAIEQQVIGVAAHRDRLLASGQHLKRGLLLHGAPGTGKTHTVRYLISKLPELTVVILTGEALHLVGAACSIARTLAPAVIVIEDVDLIAEHRGMHPGQHPMLFQLLNEMDGLAEDVDVTFILTTNRADLLEPALAARPGRVDQAVAFELPDAGARRRLLELYRGGLTLDLRDSDLVIERTEGVTASFLKELLRKAALIAADQDAEGTGALTVTSEHLSAALDSLLDERNELTRLLLGARPE
jgi:hypothetical protein